MPENDPDSASDARDHLLKFLLWKRQWEAFEPSIHLAWDEFPFSEQAVPNIPNYTGVYAFCIRPDVGTNLITSYLLYIGETTRPMRVRFREYLAETYDPIGRSRIYHFFGMYRPYIRFLCAPVPDGVSPRDVEKELLVLYTPPCNMRFPAQVQRVMDVVYQ